MAKNKTGLFPSQHGADSSSATKDAYGDCPKCKSALQLKHVGKSTFLGCSAYPECDYSHSLQNSEVSTLKTIENSACPECKALLAVKKGQYGMFIGCTNFPQCHYISNKQSATIEAEYEPVDCPSCKGGQLHKKQNRFGKFFYACDNYPKCKQVFNQEPIKQACPACQSIVMLRKTKGSNTLICADSSCAHEKND